MEWVAPLASLVTIVVGILAAGEFIDRSRTDEATEELGRWLSGQEGLDPTSWVQKVNGAFRSVFDWLYSFPQEKWQGKVRYENTFSGLLLAFLWGGLLLAPVVLIAARVGFWVMGVHGPDTAILLLISVGIAYSNLAPAVAVWWVDVRSKRESRGLLTGFFLAPAVVPPLVLFGVFIYVGVQEAVTAERMVLAALVAAIFTIVGSFGAFGVPVGFGDPEGGRDNPHPVNPLKALVSSLVFIVILGLIQRDAGLAFIQVINQEGLSVLGFVAFNIFADAVSLVETRWVLTRGAKAGIWTLVGLLLLDLILSAAIFLVIPTILWELPQFWEAFRFAGPRPWLGILFWSTFSTSVMFYLFVVAVLLVRPMVALINALSKLKFDLNGHPIRCISVAMSIEVVGLFAVGAVVSAITR